MNLRKPPQERKTPKRIDDRDLGRPDIELRATDDTVWMAEIGESRWPPTFRGREEIEYLRDYLDAWLEAHDEEGE